MARHPTPNQLDYLESFGYSGTPPKTMGEASLLLDQLESGKDVRAAEDSLIAWRKGRSGGGCLGSIKRVIGYTSALIVFSVVACCFLAYWYSGSGTVPSQPATKPASPVSPTITQPTTPEQPQQPPEIPATEEPKTETPEPPTQTPAQPTPSEAETKLESPLRTWSDNTGGFKVEAEFVSFGSGKVRLRKADGSEIQVPLERLSEADVEYVRGEWQEKGLRPPF
jgi:hypothetical protein